MVFEAVDACVNTWHMAADGVGEIQAPVGGLLLARDDGDALPTQFKVRFISLPMLKKSWAGHFSSLQYPGYNHISLSVRYIWPVWSCHPFKRISCVTMWSRLIWRPCRNKLGADINRTQRSYHKIIAKCMVICSALSASRDAHQPLRLLRLSLFIVSSWWWVLCLIKERALDLLTIWDHRIPLFQYLSRCRHQTVTSL